MILLASSRTEICDDIDTVLASHRMLLGPRQSVSSSGRGFDVIKATHTANQTRLLVHLDSPILDPAWDVSEVSLEEIVLAYMGMDQPVSAGSLSSVRTAS
jgi:ABC-2 type transport system ATP-binding protein